MVKSIREWMDGPPMPPPAQEPVSGPLYGNGVSGVRPQAEVRVLDAATYRRRIWITLVVIAVLLGVGTLELGEIAVSAARFAGLLP